MSAVVDNLALVADLDLGERGDPRVRPTAPLPAVRRVARTTSERCCSPGHRDLKYLLIGTLAGAHTHPIHRFIEGSLNFSRPSEFGRSDPDSWPWGSVSVARMFERADG